MAMLIVWSFSDGSVWAAPIKAIAANRAHYYADLAIQRGGAVEDYSEVFREEMQFLEHTPELVLNWATSSMDWSELKPFARMVDHKETDYGREWNNGILNARLVTADLHISLLSDYKDYDWENKP